MMVLSIIIPVYNISQYLPRCIDSLLCSSRNYEIILIDDGSTDDSGKICDQYADTYDVVSAYHKQNGGVSSARNLGLTKATGKYVYFVDGDDWVDRIDSLITTLRTSDSPCLCVNYDNINSEGTICKQKKYVFDHTPSLEFAKQKDIHFHALWGFVYLKENIDKYHLKLNETLRYSEDWLFCVQYLALCPEVASCKDFVYHYRIDRVGSAMNTAYTVKDIWSYLTVYDSMHVCKYIEGNRLIVLSEEERCLSYILNVISANLSSLDKREIQKALRERINCSLIKASSIKNGVKFLVAYLNIRLLNKVK
ncbi:glycosyltransferase family 2 protein [Prevotella dentasini]